MGASGARAKQALVVGCLPGPIWLFFVDIVRSNGCCKRTSEAPDWTKQINLTIYQKECIRCSRFVPRGFCKANSSKSHFHTWKLGIERESICRFSSLVWLKSLSIASCKKTPFGRGKRFLTTMKALGNPPCGELAQRYRLRFCTGLTSLTWSHQMRAIALFALGKDSPSRDSLP